MTRLRDAAAINAAAGPHWDSLQPEPDYPCCEHCTDCPGDHSRPCVRCEQAVRDSADRQAARAMNESGAVNLEAVTAVFLLSLVGSVLFILAVMGGRHVMCSAYAHRTDGPNYCATAVQR